MEAAFHQSRSSPHRGDTPAVGENQHRAAKAKTAALDPEQKQSGCRIIRATNVR
jgi:hypothetical protein